MLDTNIYISERLFQSQNCAEIIKLGRQGELEIFVSVFILNELDSVLKIKFSLPNRFRELARKKIREFAILVNLPHRAYVKADDNVLDLAVAVKADYLVTGDKKHLLGLKEYRGIKIVSPAEFLKIIKKA